MFQTRLLPDTTDLLALQRLAPAQAAGRPVPIAVAVSADSLATFRKRATVGVQSAAGFAEGQPRATNR